VLALEANERFPNPLVGDGGNDQLLKCHTRLLVGDQETFYLTKFLTLVQQFVLNEQYGREQDQESNQPFQL
jgi:hypothetical protein